MQRYVECRNKIVTSNSSGNRNNRQIIKKISEQRKWKARHEENNENSHTGLCEHPSESINVDAQNVYHWN
jgi:hypothetical protein